ncbi:addiction module toxin, RelE/StbE family [Methanocaldococcus vulcanius M7]|uniref:Addiction module toxin, RelE/StbE family n=1 Tax=Methanocaldococcus vulcanius (strain ATCC 700851 / DSM 12094 / M7) TaxID=579137 RepID=C9RFU7_METVM|nr:type II toxin-antitoxin system RelE/ParE family toxin [Methanocaldococcus vulcanius]ACX72449.1 addiction module toxin, RelE/StbE family [Methanocaldococcus vulcanius M7]
MKVLFAKTFAKDLKNVPRHVRKRIKLIIENFQNAKSLNDLNLDIKKIKGYQNYYRIRVGNYRVGIEINGDTIIFRRVLHRKNIYDYFP